MKVTKKERKAKRQLAVQRNRVTALERCLMALPPIECPVRHHFTDNGSDGMDLYCREFFVPAGVALTGVIYKIEAFLVLAKGKMRFIVGDGHRDYEAPCLLKNVPGTKNGAYAFEDCLFYSFSPNPGNSRDLVEAVGVFSATDPNEVQGMGNNRQQLLHKAIAHAA
jgi:hypothetical protein